MTNAILMASGLGTRMRPLTENRPKPLIKVHGEPMIESILKSLQAANVRDIYVVVGYLAEQFEYLKDKYPNITLIHNPDYNSANNISSIYYAAEFMKQDDCFVCEADLYIPDPNILMPIPTFSGYYGKMIRGRSDDWVFDINSRGYITRVGKNGNNCYNMTGISFFKKKEAAYIAEKIQEKYAKSLDRNLFWDEVVNENLSSLALKVLPIGKEKIIEIDTVDELNSVNANNKIRPIKRMTGRGRGL